MRHINTTLWLSLILITPVYLSTNFKAVKCVISFYLCPLYYCFSRKYWLKLNFIFYAANDNDSSSCRKCLLCVARSVNKTPTAAVLKEALETVSEIELLLHPGSFTVSLAMFWRVWFLILMTFFFLLYNQQTPRTVEDLPTTSTEKQMKVVGLLDEGSVLSIGMEDPCANQPIYVVVVRRARNSNDKEAGVDSDEDVNELVDKETRKPGVSLK